MALTQGGVSFSITHEEIKSNRHHSLVLAFHHCMIFLKNQGFSPISLVPLLLLYIAINQEKHTFKKQQMKTKRNIDLAHHFPNPTSLYHSCQEIKQQTNCKLFPPLSYSCFFPSQFLRKKSKRKHTHIHFWQNVQSFLEASSYSSCFKIFHVHPWQNE